MIRMTAIGLGQWLLPVSLFHAMRTTIIGGEARVYLIGAWAMMLRVGPYVKFLSHLSHVGLILFIICLSIKQNFGHAWPLRSHTLGKLVLFICLSIKQNLNNVWLLRPHTLGKLILFIICLSIKQNLGHAWLLGPHTLGKLILFVICLSIKQNLGHA